MSFSSTKQYVFSDYINALGNNTIKKGEGTYKVYITDYDFIDKCIEGNDNFSLHSKDTGMYLENVDIWSFNSNSLLSASKSYEELNQVPCSSKIFSIENNGCSVTMDLEWSISAPNQNSRAEKYFQSKYNFSNVFDQDEYYKYNVNQVPLEEDVASLKADDYVLNDNKGNKSAMSGGANGLLLVHSTNDTPVAYYQFAKPFYSNKNNLEVDWHLDGILKIE